MATTLGQALHDVRDDLAATYLAGASSLLVGAGQGAKYAGASATAPLYVRIDDEVLAVTGRSGDTLTVTGAQEGTTAANHAAGSQRVEVILTAGMWQALRALALTLEAGLMNGGTAATTTTPRVSGLYDANGAVLLGATAVASAVNYLRAKNGAAGSPGAVALEAAGSSTDIDVYLSPQGAGKVVLHQPAGWGALWDGSAFHSLLGDRTANGARLWQQRGTATSAGTESTFGSPTRYFAGVTVTFPVAFTSAPRVHCTLASASPGAGWVYTRDVSTTGFTAIVEATNTGLVASQAIHWLAIGG